MKVYGDSLSGNCLKVRYAAQYLKIPFDWVEVDTSAGATRTDAYLRRNPQGQVPLLELDDGRYLAQSNAIIRYLARGSALLPDDPYWQAKVDELLFWEQYSHEPYVATCRTHMVYKGQPKETREPWRVERAEQALDYLEQLLDRRTWLVGDDLTVADIALVAYTRLAHEGGFDLTAREHVRAWIHRVEARLGIDA